jgi:hypothetical protein
MINEVFYLMTQIFLKLSLGIFFLRILVLKYQRRICQVTIIFSIIINAYHIFFVIFQCGDPRKFAENLVNKRCVSQRVSVGLAYEQASSSVITDLAFATMPIFLLWNVNLNVRAKISAGLIMSLGAL